MTLTNRSISLAGLDEIDATAALVRAEVRDGMGRIPEIDLEFVSDNFDLPLDRVLDRTLSISVAGETVAGVGVPDRIFTGRCVEICFQGQLGQKAFYFASLRPWPWLLTQSRDCRIFEGKTTQEIVTEVIRDHVAPGLPTFELSSAIVRHARPYCVQYRETAFDFIYRLLVEDGITFRVEHSHLDNAIVFVDEPTALPPVVETRSDGSEEDEALARELNTIRFKYRESVTRDDDGIVHGWSERRAARSAKVTVEDYDYEAADAELTADRGIADSGLGQAFAIYDYPGHFARSEDASGGLVYSGDTLAEGWARSIESEIRRAEAEGNSRRIAPGHRFHLGNHADRAALNAVYTVLTTIHRLQIETDYGYRELGSSMLTRRAALPPLPLQEDIRHQTALRQLHREVQELRDIVGVSGSIAALPESRVELFERYSVTMEVQPGAAPIALPRLCRRPVIPGLQTARVIGRTTEAEVDTDAQARVRVQFHWNHRARPDRDQPDETASCWVRTAMPWSGNGYGVSFVPRIGQEVVVQFEEGNPDRPVIVGTLYNSTHLVPIDVADLETQTGFVSRSTTGGRGAEGNRLIFDDAKDVERLVLHAEKDLVQTVNNDAGIAIGAAPDAGGGNLTLSVAGDSAVTVDGTLTETIRRDRTVTVDGTLTETIEGDRDVTSKSTVRIEARTIVIEAEDEIEIRIGKGNRTKLKLDSDGVTIKGSTIRENP